MKSYLTLLCSILLISSCTKYKTDPPIAATEVIIGKGIARSYLDTNVNGVPQTLGIEMSASSLTGLGDVHSTFLLGITEKAREITPFDHIVIDWNPAGHMPNMVYDVAHFDFHFYKISIPERWAIPTYAAQAIGFDKNPPVGYLPINYISPPDGSEPKMGKHWVDTTSPELNGQPFATTFIYGTYDGNVNFLEPMASMNFLQTGRSVSIAFPQPKLFFPTNTFYPTQYNIFKDVSRDKYYITLTNFINQ